MSAQMIPVPPVPRETARTAYAIFGRNNFYIQIGEQLETLLEGTQLELISRTEERLSPPVTIFQALESLTDAQASDAIRTRIDWKYALHLPIIPPVVSEIALCEFRQGIVSDPASQGEFQKLIDRFLSLRSPIENKIEHPEVPELLFDICSANRLNWAWQTMCKALEALAGKYPDWLRRVALPHWYGRYNRLSLAPASSDSICQQELSMKDIGADIHHLIVEMIHSGHREMNGLQEVKSLYRLWMQQYKKWNETRSDQQVGLTPKDCESCFHAG